MANIKCHINIDSESICLNTTLLHWLPRLNNLLCYVFVNVCPAKNTAVVQSADDRLKSNENASSSDSQASWPASFTPPFEVWVCACDMARHARWLLQNNTRFMHQDVQSIHSAQAVVILKQLRHAPLTQPHLLHNAVWHRSGFDPVLHSTHTSASRCIEAGADDCIGSAGSNYSAHGARHPACYPAISSC